MERPVHRHDRPIDRGFYQDIRLAIGERALEGERVVISPDSGTLVAARAGSAIAFELLEGPLFVRMGIVL